MGHNSFGKKREDQLFYQNCKLEKANEELVKRINEELVPALNAMQEEQQRVGLMNRNNLRIITMLLFELGGEVTLQIIDLESADCILKSEINKDQMSVRFWIESNTKKGDEEGNGKHEEKARDEKAGEGTAQKAD